MITLKLLFLLTISCLLGFERAHSASCHLADAAKNIAPKVERRWVEKILASAYNPTLTPLELCQIDSQNFISVDKKLRCHFVHGLLSILDYEFELTYKNIELVKNPRDKRVHLRHFARLLPDHLAQNTLQFFHSDANKGEIKERILREFKQLLKASLERPSFKFPFKLTKSHLLILQRWEKRALVKHQSPELLDYFKLQYPTEYEHFRAKSAGIDWDKRILDLEQELKELDDDFYIPSSFKSTAQKHFLKYLLGGVVNAVIPILNTHFTAEDIARMIDEGLTMEQINHLKVTYYGSQATIYITLPILLRKKLFSFFKGLGMSKKALTTLITTVTASNAILGLLYYRQFKNDPSKTFYNPDNRFWIDGVNKEVLHGLLLNTLVSAIYGPLPTLNLSRKAQMLTGFTSTYLISRGIQKGLYGYDNENIKRVLFDSLYVSLFSVPRSAVIQKLSGFTKGKAGITKNFKILDPIQFVYTLMGESLSNYIYVLSDKMVGVPKKEDEKCQKK